MTLVVIVLLVLLAALVAAIVLVLVQKARLLNAERFRVQGEGLLVSKRLNLP